MSVPIPSYHLVRVILGADDDEYRPDHSANASLASYPAVGEHSGPIYDERGAQYPTAPPSWTPRRGNGKMQARLETGQCLQLIMEHRVKVAFHHIAMAVKNKKSLSSPSHPQYYSTTLNMFEYFHSSSFNSQAGRG